MGVSQLSHLEYLGFCPLGDPGGGVPRVPRLSGPQHRVSPPRTQVSELRQQLRLRGLPVSGTKSMLLERMRGGTPSRERSKPPRRDDGSAGGSWPRLRPKALGAARRSVRAGLRAGGPMRRGDSGMGRSSRRGIANEKRGTWLSNSGRVLRKRPEKGWAWLLSKGLALRKERPMKKGEGCG